GAAAAPRARVTRLAPGRGASPQQRALAPDRHPRGLGRDVPRRATFLRHPTDARLARRHGLAAAGWRRGGVDRGGGRRSAARSSARDVPVVGTGPPCLRARGAATMPRVAQPAPSESSPETRYTVERYLALFDEGVLDRDDRV